MLAGERCKNPYSIIIWPLGNSDGERYSRPLLIPLMALGREASSLGLTGAPTEEMGSRTLPMLCPLVDNPSVTATGSEVPPALCPQTGLIQTNHTYGCALETGLESACHLYTQRQAWQVHRRRRQTSSLSCETYAWQQLVVQPQPHPTYPQSNLRNSGNITSAWNLVHLRTSTDIQDSYR